MSRKRDDARARRRVLAALYHRDGRPVGDWADRPRDYPQVWKALRAVLRGSE